MRVVVVFGREEANGDHFYVVQRSTVSLFCFISRKAIFWKDEELHSSARLTSLSLSAGI